MDKRWTYDINDHCLFDLIKYTQLDSDIQLMIIHKVCLFYKPYDKNIIKVGSSKMMATLKWVTLDNNCQSKNQVVFSMTTFGYPTTIYVSL